ncbi:L-amino-acid oxidase-like [Mercenaria mercenaria]|uniref:L-amino-acid oxidase-like n=1 Tax=Mercenaria mercenaria TaxID=6596 RepID=UPI00234EE718|nr:L-amino-acid oxidase-like [Mercenaria mercenaria]
MTVSRSVVAGLVVLAVLLVGCVIAIVVLAVRLNDETEKSSENEKAGTDSMGMSDCDDIAIIGAGISGSYAAWRLRDKNLKIALYEYSDRIGGRCFTVQLPGIPDVNVEMGAMRFRPADHDLVNSTVHDLGLDVVDFELGYGSSGGTLYYLRGKHMTLDELATQAPYNLPAENRVDLDTLHWNVFKNFTIRSQDDDEIKSLDGVDLYKQSRDLYNNKYLDIETVQYLMESANFISEYGTDISAIGYIPVDDPSLSSPAPKAVKTVTRGFQAIPERLVEQFLQASDKHKFFRNHHLKAINKQSDGNYVLTFQVTETKAGITTEIKNRSPSKMCAKKVLLGIPRLALEHLDWEGLRQETVQDYIKNAVTEVHAGKMYFGYDNAWWRNLDKAASYAISMTPLRQTYDFAVSKTTSKGVLNPSYNDGDARIWREAVGSGELVPGIGDNSIAMTNVSVYLARKYYAELFNITLDNVPEPNSAVMAIWDQYPTGASWYEWAPGYKWDEVESRMIKPSASDDVYITSNIFSSNGRSGWIQGGMEIVEKVLKHFE